MRSSSSSVFLLIIPLLLASTAAVDEAPGHQHHHGGQHVAEEKDALFWKIGKFAVWVYSLHNGISQVPELERVVSTATRPVRNGRGVEYLLVLHVAQLGTCEAIVWGMPGEGSQEWKLKDFKPVAGA